jgi:hypothetical protein
MAFEATGDAIVKMFEKIFRILLEVFPHFTSLRPEG